METPELHDQVALITGAAKGIGRGIAYRFAEAGAHIVIADIDTAEMPVTTKEVEHRGRRALAVKADVRREADLDRAVDETLAAFGRIDIVVNNAGINAPGGFLGVNREDIRSVFDTDLIGPFILSQRAAREMIRLGIAGRILCVSSIHSVVPAYCPQYSAAKIGLEQLVVDMASSWRPTASAPTASGPGASPPAAAPSWAAQTFSIPPSRWRAAAGCRPKSPSWRCSWPANVRATSPARR